MISKKDGEKILNYLKSNNSEPISAIVFFNDTFKTEIVIIYISSFISLKHY